MSGGELSATNRAIQCDSIQSGEEWKEGRKMQRAEGETYLSDSTVACHDTLQLVNCMVSLLLLLLVLESTSRIVRKRTLIDWTPGAAILDAGGMVMHDSRN